jgi:hypothetical protein
MTLLRNAALVYERIAYESSQGYFSRVFSKISSVCKNELYVTAYFMLLPTAGRLRRPLTNSYPLNTHCCLPT